jgi:pimeloyl-ACP methyl ester carboxylesterase
LHRKSCDGAGDEDASAIVNATYSELPTKWVGGDNGIEYAYREVGSGQVPLVLLQHFRGNLDSWDPALIDVLSASRHVITFDNVGVGATTGRTPNSVEQMAYDAILFLNAIKVDQFDILGFSIGSFVAQEMALIRPDAVRRLILASSAPRGAPGMHRWAADVIEVVGKRETSTDGYLKVFYTKSAASQRAGVDSLKRMSARTVDRDHATTWETRLAQYDAVCDWGIPNHALLQRMTAVAAPVFVANGDSDPMILPHYSYLLGGLIPHARVKIYPDSAHGFLFQHHAIFAADVGAFLD